MKRGIRETSIIRSYRKRTKFTKRKKKSNKNVRFESRFWKETKYIDLNLNGMKWTCPVVFEQEGYYINVLIMIPFQNKRMETIGIDHFAEVEIVLDNKAHEQGFAGVFMSSFYNWFRCLILTWDELKEIAGLARWLLCQLLQTLLDKGIIVPEDTFGCMASGKYVQRIMKPNKRVYADAKDENDLPEFYRKHLGLKSMPGKERFLDSTVGQVLKYIQERISDRPFLLKPTRD